MTEPTRKHYLSVSQGKRTIIDYTDKSQAVHQRGRIVLVLGWLKRFFALDPLYDTCYVCKYKRVKYFVHKEGHFESEIQAPLRLCAECYTNIYVYPPDQS